VKCDFFTSENEHNKLPYNTDVTLGPVVAEPSPAPSADLSAILLLLQQQKVDTDKQNKKQNEQLQNLQNQVNQLSLNAGPAGVSKVL
jgi:hypothetical protein